LVIDSGRFGGAQSRHARGERDHDWIGSTFGGLAGQRGTTRRGHGTVRGQTVRALIAVIRCRVQPWALLVGDRWCRSHAGVSRCVETAVRRDTCRTGKTEKNSREDHGPQTGSTSSQVVIGTGMFDHGSECILPATAVSTVGSSSPTTFGTPAETAGNLQRVVAVAIL
jgi:hypothetical protein